MTPKKYSDISLDGIRGVLIDLDNTLYAYEPAHRTALETVYRASPGRLSFADFAVRYRDARTRVTRALFPQAACRSRFLAFQDLAEREKWPQVYAQALRLEALYWDAFIAAMIPDPGATDFLTRARAERIPVCLVTDMTAAVQARKVGKLGLDAYLSAYVSSEEIGAEKPDPRMFLTALAKLGVTPQDALMVGDDLEKDIHGAEAVGSRAVLVRLAGENA